MKKFLIFFMSMLAFYATMAQQFNLSQTINSGYQDSDFLFPAASGPYLFTGLRTENDVVRDILIYEKNSQGMYEFKQKASTICNRPEITGSINYIAGNYGLIADGNNAFIHIVERINGTWKKTGQLSAPSGSSRIWGAKIAPSGKQIQIEGDSNNQIYELVNGTWQRVYGIRKGSTAFTDNLALVGVPDPGDGGKFGVFIYEKINDTWKNTKLISDNTKGFGTSVSYGDGYLAVTSEMRNSDAGAVFIYNKSNNWSQEAKLTYPSQLSASEYATFPTAIDIRGTQMVVNSELNGDHKEVFVYNKTSNQWRLSASLKAPNGNDKDPYYQFGTFIQTTGSNLIIVGGDLPYVDKIFVYNKNSNTTTVAAINLINAKTDRVLTAYSPVKDGTVIDLDKIDLTASDVKTMLNIQAITNPLQIGSVSFTLSGPVNKQVVDNTYPYTIYGDNKADFFGGQLKTGSYTLVVTPYTGVDKTGTAGTTTTISFKVVNNPLAYQPETYPQNQKIFPSDPKAGQRFGYTMASADGALAVNGGTRLYLYNKTGNGWEQTQKLKSPTAYPEYTFGSVVAMSEKWLFTTALDYQQDVDETWTVGVVYTKKGSSWKNPQILTGDKDPSEYGMPIGEEIVINGNTALITSADYSIGAETYLFTYNGSKWVKTTKFYNPTIDEPYYDFYSDFFGRSLALNDEYAIMGSYGDEEFGGFAGAAYVFKKQGDSWNYIQKITAPDAQEFGYFAYAMSLSGNQLVISGTSNPGYDFIGIGKAYVYELKNSKWELQTILQSPNKTYGDGFGKTVDIKDNKIVVGDGAYNAFVFEKINNNWISRGKLQTSEGQSVFGGKTIITDDEIIAGAPFDAENGTKAGAVFSFANTGGNSNTLAISAIQLVNAANGQVITALTNGKTIDLASYGASDYNILVTTQPAAVGSVYASLTLTGSSTQTIQNRIENSAPYYVFGDSNGQPNPWQPEGGTYKLKLTPYSGANQQGTAGAIKEISFTIVEKNAAAATPLAVENGRLGTIKNPAFRSVSLVDAATNKSVQTIEDGSVINLQAFNLDNFNIQVKTAEEKSSENLHLQLNKEDVFAVERNTGAPYFVFGNLKGTARHWKPEVGQYTLHIFSGTSASGKGKLLKSIRFEINDNKQTDLAANISLLNNKLVIYPNPAEGEVTLKMDELIQNYKFSVYDAMGKLVYQKTGRAGVQEQISMRQKPGIYMVILENEGKQYVDRLMVK